MKSGIFKNKFAAILLIVSVILSVCVCVSANETETVTRADFAQAIYVMSGKNVVIPYEQLYYDVTTNDNFCNAVMYCSKNGYKIIF